MSKEEAKEWLRNGAPGSIRYEAARMIDNKAYAVSASGNAAGEVTL